MVDERDLFSYYQKEGTNKHQCATDYKSYFHRVRYRISRELLLRYAKESVILDLGCAEGWTTKWASEDSKFAVGLEISIPKVKRAALESLTKNNTFILGSWDSMPFRNQAFDLIIWLEGPEHAVHPQKVIATIYDLLKDERVLIISTMGLLPPLYYRLLRKLFRRWEKDLSDMHGWGYVSLFTRKSLLTILTHKNRFFLRKLIFIGPRFIIMYRVVCKMTNLLHIDLSPIPWPGFGCIICVLSKRCALST
jgi:SAM-dependent methyltransferase